MMLVTSPGCTRKSMSRSTLWLPKSLKGVGFQEFCFRSYSALPSVSAIFQIMLDLCLMRLMDMLGVLFAVLV